MSMEVSGKIVEKEILGDQRGVLRKEQGVEYLKYQKAMENVRDTQLETNRPYNPAEPNEERYPFAYSIQTEVGELLGFDDDDWEAGRLKLFTAVESILDKKHGVDGFFELTTKEGDKVIVTFDITTNPEKKEYKAEVIVQIPDEGFDFEIIKEGEFVDQEIFDETIEKFGEIIAQEFEYKLERLYKDKKEKQVA